MTYLRLLFISVLMASSLGAVLTNPSFALSTDELALAQSRYLQEQADCKRGASKMTACVARIHGQGRTEGNVAGAGTLRELEVTIPNR